MKSPIRYLVVVILLVVSFFALVQPTTAQQCWRGQYFAEEDGHHYVMFYPVYGNSFDVRYTPDPTLNAFLSPGVWSGDQNGLVKAGFHWLDNWWPFYQDWALIYTPTYSRLILPWQFELCQR